jgi:hypothetical protein
MFGLCWSELLLQVKSSDLFEKIAEWLVKLVLDISDKYLHI